MTPRRRDRFFSSLRQLEQRLASESAPVKKCRLEKYKAFADSEPTNSFPKCGLPDANTIIDNEKPVFVSDFRLAATSKCGLEDDIDASKCGLVGANATLRCAFRDANAASNCRCADALASSSCDVNSGRISINLTSDSGLAGANTSLRCGLNATLRCGLNAASNCGSSDITASSNCGSAGSNSLSSSELRGIMFSSNCGVAGANTPSRCGLAGANATTSFEVTEANLTSTCTPIEIKHVELASSVDINPTSMNTMALNGTGRNHSGLQWVNNHLTQTDGLVKPMHLELSKAVELAGGESVKAHLGPAKTLHVGPYLESTGLGLTDSYRTQSTTFANIELVGPYLTHVRDVNHITMGDLAEQENIGAALVHAKPAVAPLASRGIDKLDNLGTPAAHLESSEALYRLTSIEPSDLKNAADVSELVNNKDTLAGAKAVFLRSDTTCRRARKEEECSRNVEDDLPLNPQKNAMMCSVDATATHLWQNGAAGSRDNAEVLPGFQCMSGTLSRTAEDNGVHEIAEIIGGQVSGDELHEGRTKNKYGIVHRGDAVASSGDGVHIVNADYLAHGRESLDSITLCEDEEEMYDAIFSGDNEDSGSLLELSARWNPWEIGRHTGESDSHPPAEFLSTPMTNDTIDGKITESSAKSLCHDLQEQEEDDLQDLTRLGALLGLDEHAWLPEVKEASLALQTNNLCDDNRLDGALHHEHPSSTFYSNVAKVGQNSFQCAKALDFWLQRLWQLQTEPYGRALLLMAKASLQKNKDMSEAFSCKFPSIIQEWLALQCVGNQHKLI